ncbi:hypothetical protein P7C73_g6185, partial [Tremellales sp. Uapishka_1]
MSDDFDDVSFDLSAADLQLLEIAEKQPYPLSTQAPTQGQNAAKQTYHHSVAPPSQGIRKSTPKLHQQPVASTSRSRYPTPLNTEPGRIGTGFGWEHGGKRSIDGNLARHVEATIKRDEYWFGPNARDRADDEPMEVVVGPTGKYGIVEEDGGGVVDNHVKAGQDFVESLGLGGGPRVGGIGGTNGIGGMRRELARTKMSQMSKEERERGAARRREAMEEARRQAASEEGNAEDGPNRPSTVNEHPPQPLAPIQP